MFKIRIADLTAAIDNKYDYIEKMCADYIAPCSEKEDFSVSVSDAEISAEGDGEMSREYLETLAVYRKIAAKLSDFGGFLMHGVLLDCSGHGILLCADSGTGKTTHAMLWLKLLGKKCRIINGDKPLIRILGKNAYGYGTPWCGKEQINVNGKVPISAVCFLERSKENFAEGLEHGEILENLLCHVHINVGNGLDNVLTALDTAARGAKFYRIGCNMDISAAETAYSAVMGKK